MECQNYEYQEYLLLSCPYQNESWLVVMTAPEVTFTLEQIMLNFIKNNVYSG
jgi:hypothetical protein